MKKITPKINGGFPNELIGSKKPTPQYPSISLPNDSMPELKDWRNGKEYTVTLRLRQTGVSDRKYDQHNDFEVIGYDVKTGTGKMYKRDVAQSDGEDDSQ